LDQWRIIFSKRAEKDWKFVEASPYKEKVIALLHLIKNDPYQDPPPMKQLQGDLTGAYSRRINHQHRLVYRIEKSKRLINIIMMWLHYE
jgi:toxin YoeB